MIFKKKPFTAKAPGRTWRAGVSWVFSLALLLCTQLAEAQSSRHELTGTLAKVHNSGKITLGFREFSIPFSYLSARDEPIGYSVDLCRAIVEAIGGVVGREIEIEWKLVTSASRMDMVTSGGIDLECGSTTSNAERSKHVAFSPIIFIAGTKLMVKRNSPIKSFRDLQNKVVAVTAGTTNEKTMQNLQRKFGLNYGLAVGKDHEDTLALLLDNKAHAFATDDALLNSMIVRRKLQKEYMVVGEFLSYDPYGIMFRKDDPMLARVVTATIHAMGKAQELDRVYNKWFMQRLPSGERLDMPPSPHLETVFSTFGEKPE